MPETISTTTIDGSHSFRTKTGTCTITPEKIIVHQRWSIEKRRAPPFPTAALPHRALDLIGYVVSVVVLIVLIALITGSDRWFAIIWNSVRLGVAVQIGWLLLVYYYGKRFTSVIDRSTIRKVIVAEAIEGDTGYIVIEHESKGKERRAEIVPYPTEWQVAKQALIESGVSAQSQASNGTRGYRSRRMW